MNQMCVRAVRGAGRATTLRVTIAALVMAVAGSTAAAQRGKQDDRKGPAPAAQPAPRAQPTPRAQPAPQRVAPPVRRAPVAPPPRAAPAPAPRQTPAARPTPARVAPQSVRPSTPAPRPAPPIRTAPAPTPSVRQAQPPVRSAPTVTPPVRAGQPPTRAPGAQPKAGPAAPRATPTPVKPSVITPTRPAGPQTKPVAPPIRPVDPPRSGAPGSGGKITPIVPPRTQPTETRLPRSGQTPTRSGPVITTPRQTTGPTTGSKAGPVITTPRLPTGPTTGPTRGPLGRPDARRIDPRGPAGGTTGSGGTAGGSGVGGSIGGSGSGGRGGAGGPIQNPTPTIKPRNRGTFVGNPPVINDDFSRPLASTPSAAEPTLFTGGGGDRGDRRRGDGDRWRGDGDRGRGDWRGRGDDDRGRDFGRRHGSSFNISIGLGIGNFYCPPPPPRFHGCFTSFYDPFVYRSRFCGLPLAYYNYYRFHRGPFFFYHHDPCFASWRWRPIYIVDSFSCGSSVGVRYYREPCDLSFRFCDAPAFSSCGLIGSDSWTWSTHGVYRYGWFSTPAVTTVINEAPAETVLYASESLPSPASSGELRGTSARELGDVYMRLGDLSSALRVYGEHLAAYPGDVLAQRALGVALLAADRAQEGAERIELAYRIDPTLADRPFHTDILSVENSIDRITDAAAMLAASNPSSEAWFALAVLKQAQGQPGPARSALDKAAELGLAAPVVETMRAALPLENRN